MAVISFVSFCSVSQFTGTRLFSVYFILNAGKDKVLPSFGARYGVGVYAKTSESESSDFKH